MAASEMGIMTAAALLNRIEDARLFAQVVIETVREPLVVLDGELNIQLASGSFHRYFDLTSRQTQDAGLFALDDGAWETSGLRDLLRRAASGQATLESFELTHDFPRIGQRTLLLHARKAPREIGMDDILLLGFEDITERRAIEHEKERLQAETDDLVRQKGMLLDEMEHRVVNSLQIIASILMLKARAVSSAETREHLQDAHRRVISLAAVQQHLRSHSGKDLVEIGPYLTKLCSSLCQSIVGEDHPARLDVLADDGALQSADAVSLGLIVTELVINALKYAFPDRSKAAAIAVRYEVSGTDWKLMVSDNGVGRPENGPAPAKLGLGTSLIMALARRLEAQVETASSPAGMNVSITRATFTSRFGSLPQGQGQIPELLQGWPQ
jgi:two-component sensor histidine kinase